MMGHAFEFHWINKNGDHRFKYASARNVLAIYSADLDEELLAVVNIGCYKDEEEMERRLNINIEVITDKREQEKHLSKLEVLERVGGIAFLPNTQLATTTQVAQFFGVNRENVLAYITSSTFTYYIDELMSDGVHQLSNRELQKETQFNFSQLKELGVSPRGSWVWTRRSILRLGMIMQNDAIKIEFFQISVKNMYREML